MSWPIGYALSDDLSTSDDGTIRDGRGRTRAPRGWIEVPPPPEVPNTTLFARVRVSPDPAGRAFIYAEEVRLNERRYPSLHRLALVEGAGWIAYLVRTVPAALERPSGCAALIAAEPTLREMRAMSLPPPPGSDETARHAAVDAGRASAVPPRPRRNSSRTVLLVEDDVAVRDAMQLALDADGYEVAAVPHAGAAIAYITVRKRVDVVLLDLMTPVMDGWSFLTARERDDRLASVPVVIVSARAPRTPQPGVAAVLSKPVDPETVLRTIARVSPG